MRLQLRKRKLFFVAVQVPVPQDLSRLFFWGFSWFSRILHATYLWMLIFLLAVSGSWNKTCQFPISHQVANLQKSCSEQMAASPFTHPGIASDLKRTDVIIAHANAKSLVTFCCEKEGLLEHRPQQSPFADVCVSYWNTSRQYHLPRLFSSPIVRMDQGATVASPSFTLPYQFLVSI